MPVRALTQEELYNELREKGFNPTDIKAGAFTTWKDGQGNCITVNHTQDSYPYMYLNELLEPFGANYNFNAVDISDHKKYKVTKSDPDL